MKKLYRLKQQYAKKQRNELLQWISDRILFHEGERLRCAAHIFMLQKEQKKLRKDSSGLVYSLSDKIDRLRLDCDIETAKREYDARVMTSSELGRILTRIGAKRREN